MTEPAIQAYALARRVSASHVVDRIVACAVLGRPLLLFGRRALLRIEWVDGPPLDDDDLLHIARQTMAEADRLDTMGRRIR